MTPEDEQFLKHIVANPRDDAARMAWADHLMDRDDPLGFFIAEQLRNPHIDRPSSADDPLWELFRRFFHNEDQFAYGAGLTYRWPPVVDCYQRESNPLGLAWFFFQRGLPARVKCLLAWWHRHGAWAVTRFPLEYVAIADRSPLHQPILREHGMESWSWDGIVVAFGEFVNGGGPDYILPYELAEAMCYDESGALVRGSRFSTRNQATAALSDACLLWAKREKPKCAKRRRKKS